MSSSAKDAAPLVSIVTVHYRNVDLLVECIEKTRVTTRAVPSEIIVVDNGSLDEEYEALRHRFRDDPIVNVVRSVTNRGFGAGCNLGALHAVSPVLWFLNSDAWADRLDDLTATLKLVNEPVTGLVGTAVHLNDGTPSPQGGGDMSFTFLLLSSFRPGRLFRRLPRSLRNAIAGLLGKNRGAMGRYLSSFQHGEATKPYVTRGVGGASFLISKARFNALRGFDETFFLYDEDADLAVRALNLGLKNYIFPGVRVLTYPSATCSRENAAWLKRVKYASRLHFVGKHFHGLQRWCLMGITHLTWRLL